MPRISFHNILRGKVLRYTVKEKKMAKKLLCVFAIVCLMFSLASCSGGSVKVKDGTLKDSAVGGFLAASDDYVYFINGVESYSTEYKTGKVTKGALMRAKKSVLADPDADGVVYETIVSKLMVAGDKTAGVYLYDGYFYYAVPSLAKDKKGNVKNDKLEFYRTSADGSQTSGNIVNTDIAQDAKYRFVKKGDKVYLVVYSTNLYVYDAITRKEVFKYEDKTSTIQELLFDEQNGGDVFFSIKPVNKALNPEDSEKKTTSDYYEVYKVDYEKGDKVKVLDGIGYKTHGNEGGEGVYASGATIDLIRVTNGKLYFSYTSLDDKTVWYMATPVTQLTEEKARKFDVEANRFMVNDANASAVFADTSFILSDGTIIFVSEDGLKLYDQDKVNDDSTEFGLSVIYEADTIKSATLDYINTENGVQYLYYHKDKIYYKVNFDDILAGNETKAYRINKVEINDSWYKPAVVEFKVGTETHYAFVAAYNDSDYLSYLNVIDMTADKAAYDALKTDTEKEDFYKTLTKTKEKYADLKANMLGKFSKDDEKTVNGEKTTK